MILPGILLFVSTYQGLIPGKSTREDLEKQFGAPVRTVAENVFEYRVPSGGSLEAEYRTERQVVERMERIFEKPVSRAALIRSLALPAAAEENRSDREGRLVEYWGGELTIALTFAGADQNSGVAKIGYFSLELYGKSLDMARNPQVQFNPSECRDIYVWAQQERESAKRSKNTGRHQQILAIQIAAQRGDCPAARTLADGYKSAFR